MTRLEQFAISELRCKLIDADTAISAALGGTLSEGIETLNRARGSVNYARGMAEAMLKDDFDANEGKESR